MWLQYRGGFHVVQNKLGRNTESEKWEAINLLDFGEFILSFQPWLPHLKNAYDNVYFPVFLMCLDKAEYVKCPAKGLAQCIFSAYFSGRHTAVK